MIKNIFFITLLYLLLLAPFNARASYFTIHLNNGNIIKTEKHWENDLNVCFFILNGEAEIPKNLISHIASTEGSLNNNILLYLPDYSGEKTGATASMSNNNQKTEIISDLKDRISVINSNIENLKKNKTIYINQKENHAAYRKNIEEKLGKLKNTPYITSKDLKERTALSHDKIIDAENKIEEANRQISNTENMIANQERMKKRMEKELRNQ